MGLWGLDGFGMRLLWVVMGYYGLGWDGVTGDGMGLLWVGMGLLGMGWDEVTGDGMGYWVWDGVPVDGPLGAAHPAVCGTNMLIPGPDFDPNQ